MSKERKTAFSLAVLSFSTVDLRCIAARMPVVETESVKLETGVSPQF
jgi:hypothetical protein